MEDANSDSFGGTCCAETGTKTGIAVSFDTWSGNTFPNDPKDKADIEGFIIRVDDVTVKKVALPTRNGLADDLTTLQTGPRDAAYWTAGGDPKEAGSWAGLAWRPFSISLTTDGKLTVKWKGKTFLDQFQTSYFPTSGRLVFAGRTGGANEHTHVDNIKLSTTAVVLDKQKPTLPTSLKADTVGVKQVKLSWTAATDDSGTVAYDIRRDGQVVKTFVTGTSFADSGLTPNTAYAYSVQATDFSANASGFIADVSVKTISNVESPGFLTVDFFNAINGVSIDLLVESAKYTDNTPDEVRLLGSFATPDGYGENYGAKISGTLIAPKTGQYRFFLRSDDASQLWLSPDNNPSKAVMIAEEVGCCDAFKEPDNAETSEPQSLVAGRSYAIYGLVKEGGGGDYLQVAWRLEGDTTPAGQLQPIPGVYFSTPGDPSGVVGITKQPSNVTVVEGRNASFTVGGSVSPAEFGFPISYQWQKNGSDVSGANATTLSLKALTLSDSGAKYRAVVKTLGNQSKTSDEVTLTVVPDTFPPKPTAGVILKGSKFEIGIGFDEDVKPEAVGLQANYSVSPGTIESFRFVPQSGHAVLTVAGVAAGASVTVTVKNVEDIKGNKIPATTPAAVQVKLATKLAWVGVGGDEANQEKSSTAFNDDAVALNETDFDLVSGGTAHWSNYDEITFAYEEVTGDFDRVVRVEYQDPTSQWARAGLMVREALDEGLKRADSYNEANNPTGTRISQTLTIRVNPTVGATAPDGTVVPGNNSYEIILRPRAGWNYDGLSALYNVIDGFGGVPPYPNAWMRMQRIGQRINVYKSQDGVNWGNAAYVVFSDNPDTEENELWTDKLYVGMFYAPEFANNSILSGDIVTRSAVAKFREYGAWPRAVAAGGSINGIKIAGANVVIDYTGSLQQASNVTGPWTDVAGASPLSVPASGSAQFFRIK